MCEAAKLPECFLDVDIINYVLQLSGLPLTAYRLPLTAYRLPLTAYRLPLTAFISINDSAVILVFI
ncbi:hypothetical protein [Pseudoalteromonas sp. H105]|uniref:hypothetical protein n=1 Tax=Pseudoalteromonas sp. H105 TaxID=1348393 RepID=UPI00073210BC|nr:hypothetical protein [Pseudoalteromonas sp. H105]KTF15238.1 hypothetical protein ATS75_10650 [Pseudoalteromonas sp. H105]